MKTTVDIPEHILKEVLFYSKAKTQKSAILTAMEEYIRLRKSEKIADQLGQFDNFFTASDLKKMREDR
jgi:hypothetical protein